MSDAQVQVGTTLKVGFGSFALTGYVPEDGMSLKKPRAVEIITDVNGARMSKIITEPRDEFDMTLIILDTGGSIVPPAVGSTFAFTDPSGNSVSGMFEDGDVQHARSYTKLNASVVNEPDITYS